MQTTELDTDALEFTKSLTLMCVEDNKSTQLMYGLIFKDYVKEIIFANDGIDGYNKYISNSIDIIISDYDMPKLNGLEMVKNIRSSDRKTPIVLVTAIENTDIIIEALQLHVNNFLKKPISKYDGINALIAAAKLIIADNYIEDQKNSKIKELEEKEKYNSYQEDLALKKELSILRNDFYYQMINQGCKALVDFHYQPLDILSGDAYSARRIDIGKTFYLLVDGMGKGLSASLSSMLTTSFVNHLIDKTIDSNNFDMHSLVCETLEYIKPIILEEETLSIDFILLDCIHEQIEYAKFAMPAMLMQTKDKEIIKLKSNNTPISKYMRDFKISIYDTSNINKFLFYTDGMVENTTRFKDMLYISYIEKDFQASFTKQNMKDKFLWKIEKIEDDVTFIFINKLDLQESLIAQNTFTTKLDEVDNANEWYTNIWYTLTDDSKLLYNVGVVFTELFMNAFEHGNLGLDSYTKHRLIEEDTYLDTLQIKQKGCNKKIAVSISKIDYNSSSYIATQISDEGEGFDTQILSSIFRNSQSFNGRGVYVSRSSSLGIYYNSKGNSVLFLHEIENEV